MATGEVVAVAAFVLPLTVGMAGHLIKQAITISVFATRLDNIEKQLTALHVAVDHVRDFLGAQRAQE